MDDLHRKLAVQKLGRYIRESLEEREQEILRMRYGLGGGRELTQWQVAEQLGISRSYVSRLETRALLKLRRRYEAGDGTP